MKFSRLYTAAMFFGLIGAAGGEFAVGFIAAARRDGGLECLWPHFRRGAGWGRGATDSRGVGGPFGQPPPR